VSDHLSEINRIARKIRMSALHSTIGQSAVTKRSGAASRLLNACYAAIADYFVRRAAIARLRDFDDCALRDIGLARSQIEQAVRGLITRPGEEMARASRARATGRAGGRRRAPNVGAAAWN
jgi:uncharacterized protein YjiS (DUF1127 family)